MPTPEPGVPWTSGDVDDMTAGIAARNDASDDAIGLTSEQLDALASDIELAGVEAQVDALPSATTNFYTEVDEDTPGELRFIPRSYSLTPSATRSNSAAEQSLLTGDWDIPANTLALGSFLDVLIVGQLTNNTGADRTIIWKITVDGGAVFTFTTPNIPASATARDYGFDARLLLIDFIGTRMGVIGTADLSAPGGGTTANLYTDLKLAPAVPTVDVAQEVNIDFRAQMSVASASFSIAPNLFTATPGRLTTV